MAANVLATPCRVFLSHAWADNWRADVLANALKEAGFELWYDHFDIHSGHRIHDRISRGLADSDCVLVLLTQESVHRPEVNAETTRADERKLPIVVVCDRKTRASNPPIFSWTSADRIIEFDDVVGAVTEQVVTLLIKITQNEIFRNLSESNRVIFRISTTLQSSLNEEAKLYQSALMTALLKSITGELDDVLNGSYTADIGPDRNFLIRASHLFPGRATGAYAVSLDQISRFWAGGGDDLRQLVDNYIGVQPENMKRLFVFSDARAANGMRDELRAHAVRYGQQGAVLMCTKETYTSLVPSFVTHPSYESAVQQEDFVIVDFDVDTPGAKRPYSIEAILSRAHLSIREVAPPRYASVNHHAFKHRLDNPTEPLGGATPNIVKLSEDDLRDDRRWQKIVRDTFSRPTDVFHLVLISPPAGKEDLVPDSLSSLKRDLNDKLPAASRPDLIWIGRLKHDKSLTAAPKFILVTHFDSAERLRQYYENVDHSRLRGRLYAVFDDTLAYLARAFENTDLPRETRRPVFEAMEALAMRFIVRADYGRMRFPPGGKTQPAHDDAVGASMVGAQRPAELIGERTLVVRMGLSWRDKEAGEDVRQRVAIELREQFGEKIRIVGPPSEGRLDPAELEGVDCLLTFETSSSLGNLEMLEELVRADERGILILPVANPEWRTYRIPSFLADLSYVKYEGPATHTQFLSSLCAAFRKIIDSRRYFSVTDGNRALIKITRDLHERGQHEPFKSGIIRDLLNGVAQELEQIASGRYVVDIGVESSFLSRAGELFHRARQVYAVSVDAVSQFWTAGHLRDDAAAYRAKQPSNTVRLFVLTDAHAANVYRTTILQPHFEQYGTDGAVLLCSRDVYRNEFLPQVLRPGTEAEGWLDDVDFGVLKFDSPTDEAASGESIIMATLSRTMLRFDDAKRWGPEYPDPNRVTSVMEELRKLKPGHAGSMSQPGPRICRWGTNLATDNGLWEQCLEWLFGSPTGRDEMVFEFALGTPNPSGSSTAREATEDGTGERVSPKLNRFAFWPGRRLNADVVDGTTSVPLALGSARWEHVVIRAMWDKFRQLMELVEEPGALPDATAQAGSQAQVEADAQTLTFVNAETFSSIFRCLPAPTDTRT